VDVAASSLWDKELGRYLYSRRNLYIDREEQINFILELIDRYDLKYVEDPLEENDFNGFSILTREAGSKAYIVGDDLYVTNKSRISLGIDRKSGNGVIIKPNQIGDLTKARMAVDEAGRGGFLIVVSHRSGETPYPHLAHVAIAFGGEMFKCGVMGGERVIKHNEIIRIESLYGGLGLSRINK
jgi:enolase